MTKQKTTALSHTRWQPSAPLWQRAPNKQENGTSLADLMMLIPGLKHYSDVKLVHLQKMLEEVVREFGEKIVFTDINLKLNVVWVTVLPEPGLCREVALAIRERIPEAVMVGNQLKSTTTEIQANGWQAWSEFIKKILWKQHTKALPYEGSKRK
ncbi:MAG: hypothetical protein ABW104_13870 [Candidatus Thiodiazotropha sp. 6PLUC2]